MGKKSELLLDDEDQGIARYRAQFVREIERVKAQPRFVYRPVSKSQGAPGYVYVLRAENGIYKIGRSATPDTRINALLTASPLEIEVVVVIQTSDMHQLEAKLHMQFASKRGRGEWFALSADDVEYIKGLAS